MAANMDNSQIINVTSDAAPAELGQALPMLREISAKSREIKSNLTSTLSKTSFNQITIEQVSGKGNCKITKETLAGSLFSLIKLIDAVETVIDSDPPILYTCTNPNVPTKDTSAYEEYLASVQCRLDGYCDSMTANQQSLDTMIKTLSDLVSSSSSSSNLTESTPAMTPNTESPHAVNQVLCEPYVWYTKDLIPESYKDSLVNFISANEADFKNIGGNRDTLYFGEYGYKYNGGEHKANAMPAPLKDLIELLKPQLTNTGAVVNSCLITRYKTGSDHIPLHRDNEPVFNPDSEILTVSLGGNRTMKFVDNLGEQSQELILEDRSVLAMSRKAQDFWQHEILKSSEPCSVRYSVTLRHVAPHFLNSTVIIGDSNTRYLQFGEERGKFGKWMPGKRVEALHVEDIPEPFDIGPYRNIVIHTGINNIKNRNRKSSHSLCNILETKIRDITKMYPRSKIHISLLLPTKLPSLNYHVREFNSILHDISHSIKNVNVVDHPFDQLCDTHGCLRGELGRYDRQSNGPLTRDTLHLGKKGLCLLAKTIKSCIVKSRSTHIRPGQQGATSNSSHDGYQLPG